tara:strand:- start:887 stop:1966 length:1080 start_codon:yes stop_codon:yes gene_type:complete
MVSKNKNTKNKNTKNTSVKHNNKNVKKINKKLKKIINHTKKISKNIVVVNQNIIKLNKNTKKNKNLINIINAKTVENNTITSKKSKSKKQSIKNKQKNLNYELPLDKLILNQLGEILEITILILIIKSHNKFKFINLFKKHILHSNKIDNKLKILLFKIYDKNKKNEKKLMNKFENKLNSKNIGSKNINKNTHKNINKIKGGGEGGDGPYLQRLTGKGDLPITGNDMKKTVDEILEILGDIRYLDDFRGATEPTVFLNYLNGNEDTLKQYLRYNFAPKFYSLSPPMINFKMISERWDNIVDYLNLYKHDRKIKNQWKVDQGIVDDSALEETFIDKLASKIDAADSKFQQAKRMTKFSTI